MPGFKTVAGRAYATLFWLAFAAGAATVTWFAVTGIHDALALEDAQTCLRRERAKLDPVVDSNWRPAGVPAGYRAPPQQSRAFDPDKFLAETSPEWAGFERCGVEASRPMSDANDWWLRGAWWEASPGKSQLGIWALSFLSFLPLVLVVALGRWVRWMARPDAP